MDIFTAVSLNNKIMSKNNEIDFKSISTNKLLEFREKIRNNYNTIIVEANTVKQDNPKLLNKKRNNMRIVIDKYQDLDMNLKIFNDEPERTYIIVLNDNQKYKKEIEKRGAHYIVANTNQDLIKKIHEISNGKILIEGGAKIINQFINENEIDSISLIQFPVIYPNDCLSMFEYVDKSYKLQLEKNSIIDEQFVYFKYKVDHV